MATDKQTNDKTKEMFGSRSPLEHMQTTFSNNKKDNKQNNNGNTYIYNTYNTYTNYQNTATISPIITDNKNNIMNNFIEPCTNHFSNEYKNYCLNNISDPYIINYMKHCIKDENIRQAINSITMKQNNTAYFFSDGVCKYCGKNMTRQFTIINNNDL